MEYINIITETKKFEIPYFLVRDIEFFNDYIRLNGNIVDFSNDDEKAVEMFFIILANNYQKNNFNLNSNQNNIFNLLIFLQKYAITDLIMEILRKINIFKLKNNDDLKILNQFIKLNFKDYIFKKYIKIFNEINYDLIKNSKQLGFILNYDFNNFMNLNDHYKLRFSKFDFSEFYFQYKCLEFTNVKTFEEYIFILFGKHKYLKNIVVSGIPSSNYDKDPQNIQLFKKYILSLNLPILCFY